LLKAACMVIANMKRQISFCIASAILFAACTQSTSPSDTHARTDEHINPSQEAFDLLYKDSNSLNTNISWLQTQCAIDTNTENLTPFRKRVMARFAPRIACSGEMDGVDERDNVYGTFALTFATASMNIKTDAIGGIIQSLDISPEAGLDRAWFDTHRADFADGYDQHMDWNTDHNPDPLIETYWAREVTNVQVRLTLRTDGTLAQIWFSDPN